MNRLNELRQWIETERNNGLVNVKFSPGSSREVSLELAAGDALALLKHQSKYAEDITGKDL